MIKAKINAIVDSIQNEHSMMLSFRARLSIATVFCAIAWTSVAFAQENPNPLNDESIADIQQRLAQHLHTIVGSENPGAIPFGEKMRAFFIIQAGGRDVVETKMRESIMSTLTISQTDADKLAAFGVKEAGYENVRTAEATLNA